MKFVVEITEKFIESALFCSKYFVIERMDMTHHYDILRMETRKFMSLYRHQSPLRWLLHYIVGGSTRVLVICLHPSVSNIDTRVITTMMRSMVICGFVFSTISWVMSRVIVLDEREGWYGMQCI